MMIMIYLGNSNKSFFTSKENTVTQADVETYYLNNDDDGVNNIEIRNLNKIFKTSQLIVTAKDALTFTGFDESQSKDMKKLTSIILNDDKETYQFNFTIK